MIFHKVYFWFSKKKKNSKEKVYSYGLNRHAFKIAIQKLQIILIISWKASLKWMYSYAVFKGITWEGATGGSCGTVEIWRGFSGVLLAATWEVWGWYWGNRWVAGWIGQTGWLASTCCRGVCCDMGCCQERKKTEMGYSMYIMKESVHWTQPQLFLNMFKCKIHYLKRQVLTVLERLFVMTQSLNPRDRSSWPSKIPTYWVQRFPLHRLYPANLGT